jgi:hypothetical protein
LSRFSVFNKNKRVMIKLEKAPDLTGLPAVNRHTASMDHWEG